MVAQDECRWLESCNPNRGVTYKKAAEKKVQREKQKFQPKTQSAGNLRRESLLSATAGSSATLVLPWGLGCLLALKGQELLQLWELNRKEKDYFHQSHCRSLPFYKVMHHNASH